MIDDKYMVLIFNSDLKPKLKLILFLLRYVSNEKGRCTISMRGFYKYTSLSRHALSRKLLELKDLNLISFEHKIFYFADNSIDIVDFTINLPALESLNNDD